MAVAKHADHDLATVKKWLRVANICGANQPCQLRARTQCVKHAKIRTPVLILKESARKPVATFEEGWRNIHFSGERNARFTCIRLELLGRTLNAGVLSLIHI